MHNANDYPYQTLHRRAQMLCLVCSALCAAVLALAGALFVARAVALAVGAAAAAGGLWCFFKAWRAAPDGAMVALWYAARILLVYGAVLLAMFVPRLDALGVALPQLFPIPVVAILMLKEK